MWIKVTRWNEGDLKLLILYRVYNRGTDTMIFDYHASSLRLKGYGACT